MIKKYTMPYNKKVLFYPYTVSGSSYIGTMQQMIESVHEVENYVLFKKNIYDFSHVKAIYLNWIESTLDHDDRKLLKKAKFFGIKIIWVFHNKVPHEKNESINAVENIRFLINISNVVMIHSHSSIQILQEYVPDLDKKKIHFLPHPDFIGDYKNFQTKEQNLSFKDSSFVFAMYGQIRPYKNIEVLIEAFKRLKENYNCKLLVVGRPCSNEYGESLLQLARDDERIVLQSKYISDIEMGRYLNISDVLVLPYSLRSSMNSGVMIMAFSYRKTVIVPDICMADEYEDDLIYKYSYENEKEHIEILSRKMEEAYLQGKEENAKRGDALFNLVKRDNAKEKVKKMLLEMI